MQKDYAAFYKKITAGLQSDKKIKQLNLCNSCFTDVFYIAYPILLIFTLSVNGKLFWKMVLIPAISFAVLSWIRAELNWPRPYEKEDIVPLIIKDTQGHSMPSRHVFSAVIIAMAYLYLIPWLGIVLLIIAGLSGWIRILGGVHYPKDVAAGYGIGILCGMLFVLI